MRFLDISASMFVVQIRDKTDCYQHRNTYEESLAKLRDFEGDYHNYQKNYDPPHIRFSPLRIGHQDHRHNRLPT